MEEFGKEEESAKASASGSPFSGFQTRVKKAYERIKRFVASSADEDGKDDKGKKGKQGEEKEKEKDKGKDEAKAASG